LVDPEPLIPSIRNAGAIFAGALAAETFGDYLAGSSHVLPTDGAARAWSGVSVYSFLKAMSVQQVSPEAARAIAPAAAALARLEGLEAHARAADARIRGSLPLSGWVEQDEETELVLDGYAPLAPPDAAPDGGRGE
jgi:histidinol dehydrogenase